MNLSKVALGLLELFDLKTQGQNPQQFGETVQPVVDVADMFGAQTGFTANSVLQAAGAISASGNVPVTTLRRWRGVSMSVTVGAAAGTYLRLRFGLRVPSVANANMVLSDVSFTPRIGQVFSAVFFFPQPVILPQGSMFSFQSLGDAGGADHSLQTQSWSDQLTQLPA